MVSEAVIDKDFGMFLPAYSLVKINPNGNKLDIFKFAGSLIGYAIFQRQTVNIRLLPAYYKLLLGKTLEYTDLQSFDREIFSSINKVVTKDITDWGLTSSIDIEVAGVTKTINLIRDTTISQENKGEFVRYELLAYLQTLDRIPFV